jgi:hypothetical protein
MKAQKTLNTNIIGNFLRFPTHPYMTCSGKQNQRYRNLNTGRKHKFWQKVGNKFGVGARYELVPGLSYKNNLFRNEVWLMILSDGGWISSGTCFSSVLPFWIESVQSEQSSQKKLLTPNDTDSGKTCYTKVVDNFNTIPEIIYTPSPAHCPGVMIFGRQRVLLKFPVFRTD